MISIIIPVYNAEKYISQTLNSVLNQTLQDFEIIITDDGSTDNSKSIIAPYLKDPRIVYLYQQNSGVSIARNNGIEQAKGEFIAFLDADDVWLKDNLEKKNTLLNSHADIFWTFSDYYHVDQNLKIIGDIRNGTDFNIVDSILLWEREVVPGIGSNVVAKKICFNDGLRFDPAFSTAADQDFCLNLASKYKGMRIAEALWYYRISPQSMSRNVQVLEKDHVQVYLKAKKNGLFKSKTFMNHCFSNLFIILAGNYWVYGNYKKKAIKYILKAFYYHPPNILIILKKLISNLT